IEGAERDFFGQPNTGPDPSSRFKLQEMKKHKKQKSTITSTGGSTGSTSTTQTNPPTGSGNTGSTSTTSTTQPGTTQTTQQTGGQVKFDITAFVKSNPDGQTVQDTKDNSVAKLNAMGNKDKKLKQLLDFYTNAQTVQEEKSALEVISEQFPDAAD